MRVNLDPQAHLDQQVFQASPDPMEPTASRDPKVSQEYRGQPENRGPRARGERLAPWDREDLQDLQEIKAMQDPRDHQANQDKMVKPVPQELQVYLVIQGHWVHWVQWDKRESKDKRESRDIMVVLGPADFQETWDRRENQAHTDPQDLRATVETLDRQDSRDHQGQMAPPDFLDQKESMDPRANQAVMAQKVFQGPRDPSDPQDPLESSRPTLWTLWVAEAGLQGPTCWSPMVAAGRGACQTSHRYLIFPTLYKTLRMWYRTLQIRRST